MYFNYIQLNISDHNGGPSLLRDQDRHSHSYYSIHSELRFFTQMDKEENNLFT